MKNDSRSLDGQWVTLVPPRTPEDTDPALDDLDEIVREYGGRDEMNKAPVVFGPLSQGSQEPIARIEEIRRRGNSLEGRFGKVDPRVEFLHSRGAFPRKSVRLKRSPGALSLESVGLIRRPVYSGGNSEAKTSSLDDLMKEHTGTREMIFGEPANAPDFSGGYVSVQFNVPEIRAQIAKNAISDLKKRGRWCNKFERFEMPALFTELVGSRGFPLLSTFLETAVEHDPTGALLSECATYLAREKGISFGEALDAAMAKPKLTGDALTDLAYARSREKNISFSEALNQIAEERPELTALGRGHRSAV